MRDLANQSFSKQPRSAKFNPKIFIIFVLVAVVGGAILSRLSGKSGVSSQVVLREAPRGLEPVTIEGLQELEGENLRTSTARFSNLKSSIQASATATRSVGSGTFLLSIEANLPDPQKQFYEVWLIQGEDLLSAGKMTGSARNWELKFRSSENLTSRNEILISLESTDQDKKPEEKIMQASF